MARNFRDSHLTADRASFGNVRFDRLHGRAGYQESRGGRETECHADM
jgi:hypothetical protein